MEPVVILPAGSDKPATAILPGGQVVRADPGESLDALDARLANETPPL